VFACPKCGNLFSTYSEGNYLKCDKCSINYEYDEYGYLVESEDKKYSIKELAAFSIDKYLDYLYENIDNIQFSIRDNCQIYQAFPRKRILLGEGKFVMSAFAFTVAYGDTIHVIKYEDAFCAIEVKNKFTIGSDDKKYLLIFDNHVAVLKYLIAFQFFNYYANGKITPNYKDELWFGQ
ncbi:MAG: hypothetical protein LBV51_03610, partial [Acholeplasmatales bacterium]|jgi:hypothetical protein|nr:hypothetical protein [Acholeplasmatales bacterium]